MMPPHVYACARYPKFRVVPSGSVLNEGGRIRRDRRERAPVYGIPWL
jgi:hypothetical protein